jgi:ATP-binding cassette subfamily B protein
VALARALLQDAPVLVLDEPTAGLDPVAAESLLDTVRERTRDRATLLITHDRALAAMADEVVVLTDGRVSASGPPTEVLLPV